MSIHSSVRPAPVTVADAVIDTVDPQTTVAEAGETMTQLGVVAAEGVGRPTTPTSATSAEAFSPISEPPESVRDVTFSTTVLAGG
jgi:hypothetical protein